MSEQAIPVQLVTGKTDAEKAATYRAELMPILEKVAGVLNRARAEGLIVGFSVNADQYGRHRIQVIDVTRPL